MAFQDLEVIGSITSWDGFAQAVHTWFGPLAYEDPMEALTQLRQTSFVASYKSQFECLSNQLQVLTEPSKLSCFLSEFHEDICLIVRMLNPPNLHVTFGLAKMEEENVATLRQRV